jgi:hypothetical protein
LRDPQLGLGDAALDLQSARPGDRIGLPPLAWWVAAADRFAGVNTDLRPQGIAIGVFRGWRSPQSIHRIHRRFLRCCLAGAVSCGGTPGCHATRSAFFRVPESIMVDSAVQPPLIASRRLGREAHPSPSGVVLRRGCLRGVAFQTGFKQSLLDPGCQSLQAIWASASFFLTLLQRYRDRKRQDPCATGLAHAMDGNPWGRPRESPFPRRGVRWLDRSDRKRSCPNRAVLRSVWPGSVKR